MSHKSLILKKIRFLSWDKYEQTLFDYGSSTTGSLQRCQTYWELQLMCHFSYSCYLSSPYIYRLFFNSSFSHAVLFDCTYILVYTYLPSHNIVDEVLCTTLLWYLVPNFIFNFPTEIAVSSSSPLLEFSSFRPFYTYTGY